MREVILESGLLLPLPVVVMLRSIQDFINFVMFVDFRVFFSLGFLFHLALTVLGVSTDHLWAVELMSPRPFQVVPTTFLRSF